MTDRVLARVIRMNSAQAAAAQPNGQLNTWGGGGGMSGQGPVEASSCETRQMVTVALTLGSIGVAVLVAMAFAGGAGFAVVNHFVFKY